MATLHDLPFSNITTLAAAYRAGSLSPVEVTQCMLDRIAALDGALHSYLTVTPEVAMAQARAAEAEMQRAIQRGNAVKHAPVAAGARQSLACRPLGRRLVQRLGRGHRSGPVLRQHRH